MEFKMPIRAAAMLIVAGLFLISPKLHADMDLVLDARLGVSDSDSLAGFPSGTDVNPGFVRDEDPDTAWAPPPDKQAFVELDLSTDSASLALELDRIEIDWGDTWAEKVTVTGGPDPYTQTVLASVYITEADSAVITPVRSVGNVRVVRLIFPNGSLEIARLSVYARSVPSMSGMPVLSMEGNSGILDVAWTAIAGAHHYEIERTSGTGSVLWNSLRNQAVDRPPVAGNVIYRVRAVDYIGVPGTWSDPFELADYDPLRTSAVRMSGVVEGFYGQPWSLRTRLDVLRAIGVWGMNTYIYAPKNDDKARNRWRTPYTQEELNRFEDYLEMGTDFGVNVYYGISPGNSIDPLSGEHLDELLVKLDQLAGMGYSRFALLMDDIPVSVSRVTGQNHVDLVNNLYGRLVSRNGETELLFVPTVYSGTPGVFNEAELGYLDEMKNINQAVSLSWTGEGIFDPEITAQELRDIAALIGRKPWIWDNYPVNDFNLGLGMFLAPVEGRSADMLSETDGVLCNPMVEGMASLFAISSYGALLSDPENYDPETFGVEMAGAVLDPEVGDEVWRLLRSYFMTSEKLFPDRAPSPELAAKIETLTVALSLRSQDEINAAIEAIIPDLLDTLKMTDSVARSAAPALTNELFIRLRKLSDQAYGAVLAINLLSADLYGMRSQYLRDEIKLQALLEEGAMRWMYPASDNVLGKLIDLSLASIEERPSARFNEQPYFDPLVAEPLPTARQGQSWFFDAGFKVPDGGEWTIEADESLNAAIDEDGLVTLLPDDDVEGSLPVSFRRYWLRLTEDFEGALQVKVFPLEVYRALAETEQIDLPLTTELQEVDGVPVFLQNGMVLSDLALSQHEKMDLSGTWRKRRMELDHRLTFSDRGEESLSSMEAESGGAILPEYDDSDWETISLPAVENEMCPLAHESGPEEYWSGVWYRRNVPIPSGGSQVRLVMLGTNYVVDVWADGRYLGYHEGGYTPAIIPLPDDFSDRDRATLVFRVDSPWPGLYPGMLPHSHESDWFIYAGIVQDLYWEHLPGDKKAHLARVAVIPLSKRGLARVDVLVDNLSDQDIDALLDIDAYELDSESQAYWSGAELSGLFMKELSVGGEKEGEISIPSNGRAAVTLEPSVINAESWSPNNPKLYGLRVTLTSQNGGFLDRYDTQVGYRVLKINENNNQFQLNGISVFMPSVARFEDSPGSGRSMTWGKILSDFNQMKGIGAHLVRTGHYPNHPYTHIIADRIGLAIMEEIPAWEMDVEEYLAQSRRPLAKQMWREMIFSRMNRPSVFLWGACSECQPSGEGDMKQFIEDLHEDLDGNYPDGRIVTQSMTAALYDLGAKETFDAVDVLGVSCHFDFSDSADPETETRDLIISIHADFPEKPLLVTGFGAPSYFEGSNRRQDQLELADAVWSATSDSFQVSERGAVPKGAYVMGLTWLAMFDWYGAGNGLQTGGLLEMNRYSPKPVANRIKELYATYRGRNFYEGPPNYPLNKVDYSDGCSNMNGVGDGFSIIFLMLIFFWRRLAKMRTNKFGL